MRTPSIALVLPLLPLLPFALADSPKAKEAKQGKGQLPWTQLSRATCKVEAFLKQYPKRDGRGVVVAILDTGVDPGVAGLRKLPDGTVKVVDVQDFSGQGDVPLRPIRRGPKGRLTWHAKDGTPQRYRAPKQARRGALWFGRVAEADFGGSSVEDVNDNGRKDDVFGVLVVVPRGGGDDDALVFVDTDGDRDFADEKPLKNYRLRQDSFTWARAAKEKQILPLTCAVNVFLKQRKLVIHYDDGGHGTHVAGIAAGYRLLGQRDFHGVAPGARVISLKIGDGRLSGGATTTGSMKAAFEYAARYAREHGVRVVCNLSYGIDSELEGKAAIDIWLDDLCRKNPGLVVCVSASNSGPGLSTIGTPAAASHAISVAALLAKDTARDVMGQAIPHPYVAVFSSRGGELNKPDLATPGFATSSVPRWERWGDFWSGTSMASPYAAGLCALLLSGQGKATVRSSWVKGALQRSAKPLPGYTALDQGTGVPDLPRAAALLAETVRRARPSDPFAFSIETESPHAPGGVGPAAYWRTTLLPPRPQVYKVRPLFAPGPDAAHRTAFSRRYTLQTRAPWLRIKQRQFYLRGEQEAEVTVTLDRSQLKEPGLYVGTVRAVRADGHDDVDLRFLHTVVVPHRFHAGNGYRLALTKQQVVGWKVRRHFLAVPPGASAMHLRLSAPRDAKSSARVREIFLPDGSYLNRRSFRLDTSKGRHAATWTIAKDLVPGVWELCLASDEPGETSRYDLEVRFSGVSARPREVRRWKHAAGQMPRGSLRVTNVFARPLRVRGAGSITGMREIHDAVLKPGEDTYEAEVAVGKGVQALRLRAEFNREDFAQFTDVALVLKDPDGKVVARDAMGARWMELTTKPGKVLPDASYSLEVTGGFTHPKAEVEAKLALTVDVLYAKPIAISVRRGKAEEWTLYPGVPAKLGFRLSRVPSQLPDSRVHLGALRLFEVGTKQTVLEVPLAR